MHNTAVTPSRGHGELVKLQPMAARLASLFRGYASLPMPAIQGSSSDGAIVNQQTVIGQLHIGDPGVY